MSKTPRRIHSVLFRLRYTVLYCASCNCQFSPHRCSLSDIRRPVLQFSSGAGKQSDLPARTGLARTGLARTGGRGHSNGSPQSIFNRSDSESAVHMYMCAVRRGWRVRAEVGASYRWQRAASAPPAASPSASPSAWSANTYSAVRCCALRVTSRRGASRRRGAPRPADADVRTPSLHFTFCNPHFTVRLCTTEQ